MKVLVTGATGFIGRALIMRLLRDGHSIIALVRSIERSRSLLGNEVELVSQSIDDIELARIFESVEGVINLGGENIFGGRWTVSRKKSIMDSRIALTSRVVSAMRVTHHRPRVLISVSAVGYYGNQDARELDEQTLPGNDFLADICQQWEARALAAADLGCRVAIMRLGIVLGAEGGALQRMLPVFRRGLGGTLGSGRQYISWIHLYDLCEVVTQALTDERYQGVFNLTSPNPVSNHDFTKTLAQMLGRFAWLRIPAFTLKLVLGEAATVLLGSQRVLPRRLAQLNYTFKFPNLTTALAHIFSAGQQLHLVSLPCSSPLLRGHRPQYLLSQTTWLNQPLHEVFAFFSGAQNLGLLTPAWIDFRIQGNPPIPLYQGAQIYYRIKIGSFHTPWLTEIAIWDPVHSFVDVQLQGPYRLWWHEHHFFSEDNQTRMEDRVYYALPFGILGRLVHRFFVGPRLRRIFAFRNDAITLRFGEAAKTSLCR